MSTAETLALKYRPRRFEDIVGQKSVKMVLHQMVKQDKVPTGLLFSGVRGTGKTTSGRILAAALNCEAEDKPCAQCPSCVAIATGNSLDVYEVDAASAGNVGDIRALTETLRYSVGGMNRVVLLDEAHSMSREAFNALLKTLEEPPPNTVFILLTTESNKILETVVSRLMDFPFRRITTGDIVGRLKHIATVEDLTVADELLLTIAERSNGGMRDAVMTLDQVTRIGVSDSAAFAELMGESDFGPALVRSMLSGDTTAVFTGLDEQLIRTGDATAISTQLVSVLRDLLVLKGGGAISRQGKALEEREALVARVEPERIISAMRVLWDLKTKVRLGEDPRTTLDLAAVMVTEALAGRTRSAAPAAPTGPPRKLSLTDMRAAL